MALIWLSCIGPIAGLLLIVVQRILQWRVSYHLVRDQCQLMNRHIYESSSNNRDGMMRFNVQQRRVWESRLYRQRKKN